MRELSLFGPGFGESVLIQLAEHAWMVVDSCQATGHDQPAALEYLKEKGVDVATEVKMVVVSHWHDDHTRGISKIVQDCPNARVVLPRTFCGPKAKEFLAAVTALNRDGEMDTCGATEIFRVFSILKNRPGKLGIHINACQNKDIEPPPGCDDVHIRSLSPGDYVQLCSTVDIGNYVRPFSPKRRLPPAKPNEASIAMQIRIGKTHILLGGDQERGNDLKGWECILSDSTTPKTKATLVKIPHHAAESGYHPGMWEFLADENPTSITTPWMKGGNALPNAQDIKKILTHTQNAYLSMNPAVRPNVLKTLNRTVQKTVAESGIRLHAAQPACGHIRVRYEENAPRSLQVETLNGALHFNEIKAQSAC